jgi:nucleoside-diphosphate-sugar epimerase
VEAEAVFHFASERTESQGKEAYRETDVGGAASLRVAFPESTHFLYASTIWVYGSSDRLLDENSPLVPQTAIGRVKALVEEQFLRAPRSTILRCGMIYPGGAFQRQFLIPAHRRFYLYPGPGENLTGLVSIRDVAAFFVDAAERGLTGIYNVVDDEPLPWRRIFETVHEIAGGSRPHAVPGWLVRLALGEDLASFVSATLNVSNRKAKEAGLVLRDPDFASGLRSLAESGELWKLL